MPPYCWLCDVTQPKLNMQNQISKVFMNNFATDVLISFNSSDKQSFPPKETNFMRITTFMKRILIFVKPH